MSIDESCSAMTGQEGRYLVRSDVTVAGGSHVSTAVPDGAHLDERGCASMQITLAWCGTPELVVMVDHDQLSVTVDPRLSEHQVRHACDQLGDAGEIVFDRWAALVGLDVNSAR